MLNNRIFISMLFFIISLFCLYFFDYLSLFASFLILLSLTPFIVLLTALYIGVKSEIDFGVTIIDSLGTAYQHGEIVSMKKLNSLSTALNSLAQRLERRDKQRRQYAARLKLQNKQSTEIIEAIGHEFKNPIAAIMGYAQTIIEDPNIDPKLAVKFLDKIYQNANGISVMIDRLALAAKLESNMLNPTLINVALKSLIDETISQFALKYKKVNIDLDLQDIEVFADKTMLRLILTNLIDNACKYGGAQVLVCAKIREDYAIVIVGDKGQGIAKDDLDRLTQKFYRVRQNGWDNSLGLGLAIVDYLLKLHDSKLEIKSELGKGSEFSFALPIIDLS